MPGTIKTTHVCLVSDQPLANLIPLLLERPAKAVLLVTDRMVPQAERLMKIIRPRGIDAEKITIKPYDFGQIAKVCEKIIADNPDADLTLNTTGGTKVAAMAAFQVFFFADKRVIYLDTAADRLLQLAPEEDSTDITENLIRPRDYLAAYGLGMINSGGPPPNHPKRIKQLDNLVRLFVEDEKMLGAFNGAISQAWKDKDAYANIELTRLGSRAEELAAILSDCQVISRGAGVINIRGEENRFFCQGGWFEEYVFLQVQKLGIKNCRPLINVEVKWDEKGKEVTANEFDIVFTNRNRLFVISCKTANLDREQGKAGKNAIYELETLSERAGGIFGRAMLATVRQPTKANSARAKKMNMKIAAGRDILKLTDHLNSWLKI